MTREGDDNGADGFKAWVMAGLITPSVFVAPAFLVLLFAAPSLIGFVIAYWYIAVLVTWAVTAVPALALVQIVRAAGWPRGYCDVLIPAGLCTLLMLIWVGEASAGARLTAGLWAAAAGGIGGLTYWLVAGRPQPPYDEAGHDRPRP